MSNDASRALYNILPAELICIVLDHLLPHQSTGFAFSCRRALEITDTYISDRVPSLKMANPGVTLLWASRFQKLPTSHQSAIEATVGVLPLLDVLAPLDIDTVTIHLLVASAYDQKQEGMNMAALVSIMTAEQAASKTGLNLDLSALRRQCLEAQVDLATKNVITFARLGNSESTLSWIEKANAVAIEAGRPLPDFSGVLQECWEKKFNYTAWQLGIFVRQGEEMRTSNLIEETIEAGLRAGRTLPDSSALMQKCLETKLDLTVESVKRCAQRGYDSAMQHHIKVAEETADKAGLSRPDWSEVM
jgi:hypothetical protein